MDPNVQNDPRPEPFPAYDEEVDQQVAWEEELAQKYGQTEDDDFNGRKMTGTGFAKQKQVMEENDFYRNSGKKRKVFIKHK